MSATDSDYSIDWLASDNEDSESEREADCSRKHSQTEAADAPSPSPRLSPHLQEPPDDGRRRSGEANGGAGVRVPPPGCTETYNGTIGLCRAQHGDRNGSRSPQQALKRSRSFVEKEAEEEEQEVRKERELTSNMSEKDRFFSSKCMELRCYIQPLSLILNGLRSGRYRERLSSFQESVAMDRIQRIMGVLQNPCMGEKYIGIILKMEEMLKSWFPHVNVPERAAAAAAAAAAAVNTENSLPSKKAKFSPVTTASATAGPVTVSEPPVTDLTPGGAYTAGHLKWLHTSPICSPTAADHTPATAAAAAAPPPPPPPPPPTDGAKDRDLTQDNAVSSSTDGHTKTEPPAPPRRLPPGKINAPCLERLLKSTESIITRRETRGLMDGSWS